jgi:hypothetical protein
MSNPPRNLALICEDGDRGTVFIKKIDSIDQMADSIDLQGKTVDIEVLLAFFLIDDIDILQIDCLLIPLASDFAMDNTIK